MDRTSCGLGKGTLANCSSKKRLPEVWLAVQGQARGGPRSPGKSQPERRPVPQPKGSRSAETGKNHTAPLSRDNDKLGLLLQLEHHWGRVRLRFQPKVPGEGIGPARRTRLSKAFFKWIADGHASRRAPWLPGTCSSRGDQRKSCQVSPALTHLLVPRPGLSGNR